VAWVLLHRPSVSNYLPRLMKTKLLILGILILLFNNQIGQLLRTGSAFIYRAASLIEQLPEVLS